MTYEHEGPSKLCRVYHLHHYTTQSFTRMSITQHLDEFNSMDGVIRDHLFRLLDTRVYPKTICPSEVARALSKSELKACGASDWRSIMGPIRNLVIELRNQGVLDILQKGSVIGDSEMETIRGPIRLRSPHSKG